MNEEFTAWNAYLSLLESRGYVPYDEHKMCRKTYGVNGSAGYWCREHKVKVMPKP